MARGVLAPSFVVCAAHDPAAIQQTVDAVAELMPIYRRALEDGIATVLRADRSGRPSGGADEAAPNLEVASGLGSVRASDERSFVDDRRCIETVLVSCCTQPGARRRRMNAVARLCTGFRFATAGTALLDPLDALTGAVGQFAMECALWSWLTGAWTRRWRRNGGLVNVLRRSLPQ